MSDIFIDSGRDAMHFWHAVNADVTRSAALDGYRVQTFRPTSLLTQSSWSLLSSLHCQCFTRGSATANTLKLKCPQITTLWHTGLNYYFNF